MHGWRNWALGLLAAALVLGGGLRPRDGAGAQVGADPGMRAPELAGPTLDGKTVRLADFRGRAVFVNFWATWCPPCRAELPEIYALAKNPPPSTAVLTVNATTTETTADAVPAFLQELGYPDLPTVMDPGGTIMGDYAVIGLPTSLFISPDGIVVRRVAGIMTRSSMESMLDEALSASLAGTGTGRVGRWLPDSIPLGPFRLDPGVLFILFGLAAAYGLGSPALRRRGLPPVAGDLVSGLALGALVGAKLVAVVLEPAAYWNSPMLVLAPTFPPAALWGAAAGLAAGAWWEVRRLARAAYDWPRAVDALAAPFLAGAAIAVAPSRPGVALLLLAAAAGTAWWAGVARRAGLPGGVGVAGGLLLAAVSVAWGDVLRPAGGLPGGMTWMQVGAAAAGVMGWWWTGRLIQGHSARDTTS